MADSGESRWELNPQLVETARSRTRASAVDSRGSAGYRPLRGSRPPTRSSPTLSASGPPISESVSTVPCHAAARRRRQVYVHDGFIVWGMRAASTTCRPRVARVSSASRISLVVGAPSARLWKDRARRRSGRLRSLSARAYRCRWHCGGGRTALEAIKPRDHGSRVGVLMPAVARRESIGSPNRAESLADLGSSTRRRRTMALQHSILGKRAASIVHLHALSGIARHLSSWA